MSHHLNCWANNIWAQYCNWKLMDWLFIVHKCWHRSTYNHFSRDEIKTSKHLKYYEFGTNDLSGKTTYKLMTTFLAVLYLRPRENNQEPLNLNCQVILSAVCKKNIMPLKTNDLPGIMNYENTCLLSWTWQCYFLD